MDKTNHLNPKEKQIQNQNNLKNQQKDKIKTKTKNKPKSEESNIESKMKSNEKDETSDKIKKNRFEKKSKVKPMVKKPVLATTQEKSIFSHKGFELSVEKINKLQDKGYKDLKEIGRGSYGKVYTAKSSKYNKQLAIKVIDLNRLTQTFMEKYLKTEIELIKKLPEHQNVCKFYEIIEGTDHHLLYISMEYYENGDLYQYIIQRQNIPERQSCLWYKQIISGLQHIHRNGFAHRDLKCENILLDSKYELKIIDFGFCCRLKYPTIVIPEETQLKGIRIEEFPSETFCGSLIYSSPEVLKKIPYLPTKNDIWSSGVILYVMLFGTYPNDGQQLEEFILKDFHYIEIPKYPKVSDECKHLLNNILVNEYKRFTIETILESDWFKKEWPQIVDNNDIKAIKQYFENLNIRRQETEEFIYTGITLKSESETKSIND